jgi:hypothetical protein
MFNRLVISPRDIEGVAEMREYIATLQQRIDIQTPLVWIHLPAHSRVYTTARQSLIAFLLINRSVYRCQITKNEVHFNLLELSKRKVPIEMVSNC